MIAVFKMQVLTLVMKAEKPNYYVAEYKHFKLRVKINSYKIGSDVLQLLYPKGYVILNLYELLRS